MQSFLVSVLGMINEHLSKEGSGERAVVVNEVFYRSFLSGGLYKVLVGFRSGSLGLGYVLEVDYDYQVLEVEIFKV